MGEVVGSTRLGYRGVAIRYGGYYQMCEKNETKLQCDVESIVMRSF